MFIFKRPAVAVIATLCFVALYVLAVNWAQAELPIVQAAEPTTTTVAAR